MIRLKDLQNRVYSGKACIRFEYGLKVKDQHIYAYFRKRTDQTALPNEWSMQIVFGRTRDKDNDVYQFVYAMPKDNIPLELICATGLKYFQLHLKEEIQSKMAMDFSLGEILEGM